MRDSILKIPTFDEAQSRKDQKVATPLDEFVYRNIPGSSPDDIIFREGLQRLVAYIIYEVYTAPDNNLALDTPHFVGPVPSIKPLIPTNEDRCGSQGHLLLEDIDAFHMAMDKAGSPRVDAKGEIYSMWGRVQALLDKKSLNYIERLQKVCEEAKQEVSSWPDWCQTNLQERHEETLEERIKTFIYRNWGTSPIGVRHWESNMASKTLDLWEARIMQWESRNMLSQDLEVQIHNFVHGDVRTFPTALHFVFAKKVIRLWEDYKKESK